MNKKATYRERQKCDITYMQNLKNMIQMDLFTKQKQTDRHGKQACGDQRESVVGRDKSGAWD